MSACVSCGGGLYGLCICGSPSPREQYEAKKYAEIADLERLAAEAVKEME